MREYNVIVVNWNTREDLRECLLSLRHQGELSSVTVVDQGSTDGSVAMMRSEFPDVRVLVQNNEGYGAALNAATKESKGEYLVFSNADVVVRPGCIQALLDHMRNNPRVGLTGPRVLNPEGKRITRFSRTTMLRALLLEIIPDALRGLWRDIEQKWNTRETPFPVKYVEGAFIAVRRSFFEGIGGFDEGFSFFCEDYDLSLRFRRAGFLVMHVPAAVVVHKRGRSFSQAPEKYAEESIKSLLLFYARHAARQGLWLQRFLRSIIWSKVFVLRLVSSMTGSRHVGRRLQRNEARLKAVRNFLPSPVGESPRIAVSVIIPTRDRQCVFDLLEKLRLQTFREFEIVVVDQSSRNHWDAYDSALFNGRLRVIRSSVVGRSNAKNLGIFHARGSLLLICDDDILPPPEFVKTHLSLHQKEGIGGVSLRHTEPGLPYVKTTNMCRVTWYGRMKDNYQSDVTTYIETLTGPNMSFTRDVQRQAGFFESGLTGTSIFEEQDYSERLRATGKKILFSNDISFPHFPQSDGNKSKRSIDPAAYYRSFHHNEIIFFLKNRPRIQLLGVIPFCFLRSIKQARVYNRPLRDAWTMFCGVFEGALSYYREL